VIVCDVDAGDWKPAGGIDVTYISTEAK
jgi:hypothetical protein